MERLGNLEALRDLLVSWQVEIFIHDLSYRILGASIFSWGGAFRDLNCLHTYHPYVSIEIYYDLIYRNKKCLICVFVFVFYIYDIVL